MLSEEIVKRQCPGLYCGRYLLNDGNLSDCGACPRSTKTNESSFCVPCDDDPLFYDWLYLGFIALTVLILHWVAIDTTAVRRSFSKEVIVMHICALFEVCAAAAITLLLLEPMGTLSFKACNSRQLSDWYTLMYNPSPNYQETIHCTQEAVYPLFTMVYIFYAIAAFIMLVIRTWIVMHVSEQECKRAIYTALYFYPILALFQTVLGGLIYYTFPFIVIIASVISNATHFAFKVDQSMKSLVLSTVTNLRNLVILLGHWSLHAYGIVAITKLEDPMFHYYLLVIVPLPTIFYILTAKFTDPSKQHLD